MLVICQCNIGQSRNFMTMKVSSGAVENAGMSPNFDEGGAVRMGAFGLPRWSRGAPRCFCAGYETNKVVPAIVQLYR